MRISVFTRRPPPSPDVEGQHCQQQGRPYCGVRERTINDKADRVHPTRQFFIKGFLFEGQKRKWGQQAGIQPCHASTAPPERHQIVQPASISLGEVKKKIGAAREYSMLAAASTGLREVHPRTRGLCHGNVGSSLKLCVTRAISFQSFSV